MVNLVIDKIAEKSVLVVEVKVLIYLNQRISHKPL